MTIKFRTIFSDKLNLNQDFDQDFGPVSQATLGPSLLE